MTARDIFLRRAAIIAAMGICVDVPAARPRAARSFQPSLDAPTASLMTLHGAMFLFHVFVVARDAPRSTGQAQCASHYYSRHHYHAGQPFIGTGSFFHHRAGNDGSAIASVAVANRSIAHILE